MTCQLIETPLGNGKSKYTCPNCNQESILPSGFPHAKRQCKKIGPMGPGTHLARLLKEIGVEPSGDCKCFTRAAAMDANGAAWCAANKPVIIGWLKEAVSESSWRAVFSAAGGLMSQPWFSVLRPYESLVAEAIQRATAPASPAPQPPGR